MTFFRPKPCFWVTLTHFGALSRKHLCCALENEKEEIGWILFFWGERGRKEKRFSTHICCCCCQRPLCQNYCLTFMVFCRILSHFASYLYLAAKAFAAYFFGIFRLFRRLTQMWHRIFGSSSFGVALPIPIPNTILPSRNFSPIPTIWRLSLAKLFALVAWRVV